MLQRKTKKQKQKKKYPIYFLCIGNSCRKRSKGTDKEMRESTSSRLHLAPCERRKITLKLLIDERKGVMPDVFLQRRHQQYEWLKGRERGEKESICLREPNGRFWWECYLTAANKTAIPSSGDVTGSTFNTFISCMCIKKREMLQM